MKKTKNRNSRKAARAHRNKVTMIGITSVVCLLMVILLVQGQRLNAQASANEQRMAELEQQIEDENQRTQEIGDLEEYM